MRRYGVVVDAFSTGRLLPDPLKGRGFDVLHVQSAPSLAPYYQRLACAPGTFTKEFIHSGDIEALVEALKGYAPQFVIPGTEIGVELADLLAERLGCPGNGTAKSRARRNKYLMSEALRTAGVPAVEQQVSTSETTLSDWAESRGRYPIAIKPVDSTAADLFQMAYNPAEVRSAIQRVFSTPSFLGGKNREVLVQEYLEGTEFMVNTVSWNGKHRVTDIWRSSKRIVGSTKIYDFEDLVDPRETQFGELAQYIFAVLDALDIKFGPAHSEVIVTARGPRLVETGARLCGGLPPTVGRLCQGTSQLDLTVDVYADRGEGFQDKLITALEQHSRCITLIAPFSGKVAREPDFSPIESLKSFHSISSSLVAGDEFKQTIDLATAPGLVFLVHPKRAQVEEDYSRLRALELTTLYSFVDKTETDRG